MEPRFVDDQDANAVRDAGRIIGGGFHGELLIAISRQLREGTLLPSPILVTERPPAIGEEALFYFPGMMKIWTEDGTDPFIADPKEVKGESGQWLQLTLHADRWVRRHGCQLKLSDASHWLPLPPKLSSITPAETSSK